MSVKWGNLAEQKNRERARCERDASLMERALRWFIVAGIIYVIGHLVWWFAHGCPVAS